MTPSLPRTSLTIFSPKIGDGILPPLHGTLCAGQLHHPIQCRRVTHQGESRVPRPPGPVTPDQGVRRADVEQVGARPPAGLQQ